jgi:hypothetical protein
VSTHNEATRNPGRGSIPNVAGDNLRPGALKASPAGRPDGPALTAPSPFTRPRSPAEVSTQRAHQRTLCRISDKEADFDFVEDC